MKLDYLVDIIEMEIDIKEGYFNFILPDFMVLEDLSVHTENLLVTLFCIDGICFYNAFSEKNKNGNFVIYNIRDWIREREQYIEEYITDE